MVCIALLAWLAVSSSGAGSRRAFAIRLASVCNLELRGGWTVSVVPLMALWPHTCPFPKAGIVALGVACLRCEGFTSDPRQFGLGQDVRPADWLHAAGTYSKVTVWIFPSWGTSKVRRVTSATFRRWRPGDSYHPRI
jgi:hypothetical protein